MLPPIDISKYRRLQGRKVATIPSRPRKITEELSLTLNRKKHQNTVTYFIIIPSFIIILVVMIISTILSLIAHRVHFVSVVEQKKSNRHEQRRGIQDPLLRLFTNT